MSPIHYPLPSPSTLIIYTRVSFSQCHAPLFYIIHVLHFFWYRGGTIFHSYQLTLPYSFLAILFYLIFLSLCYVIHSRGSESIYNVYRSRGLGNGDRTGNWDLVHFFN